MSNVFKVHSNRSCLQCKNKGVSIVEVDIAQYEYSICESCIVNNYFNKVNPKEPKPKRKIVQMTTCIDEIFCLCDDGTPWSLEYCDNGRLWKSLPDIPQNDDEQGVAE